MSTISFSRCFFLSKCLVISIVSSFSPAYALDCLTPDCTKVTKYEKESISKIKYTILNDSRHRVRFRLPTGKKYMLNPGQRGQYKNSGRSEKLIIHVFNSSRSYRLRSGDHKFWWNGKEDRIGFDQNYRQ